LGLSENPAGPEEGRKNGKMLLSLFIDHGTPESTNNNNNTITTKSHPLKDAVRSLIPLRDQLSHRISRRARNASEQKKCWKSLYVQTNTNTAVSMAGSIFAESDCNAVISLYGGPQLRFILGLAVRSWWLAGSQHDCTVTKIRAPWPARSPQVSNQQFRPYKKLQQW